MLQEYRREIIIEQLRLMISEIADAQHYIERARNDTLAEIRKGNQEKMEELRKELKAYDSRAGDLYYMRQKYERVLAMFNHK